MVTICLLNVLILVDIRFIQFVRIIIVFLKIYKY